MIHVCSAVSQHNFLPWRVCSRNQCYTCRGKRVSDRSQIWNINSWSSPTLCRQSPNEQITRRWNHALFLHKALLLAPRMACAINARCSSYLHSDAYVGPIIVPGAGLLHFAFLISPSSLGFSAARNNASLVLCRLRWWQYAKRWSCLFCGGRYSLHLDQMIDEVRLTNWVGGISLWQKQVSWLAGTITSHTECSQPCEASVTSGPDIHTPPSTLKP